MNHFEREFPQAADWLRKQQRASGNATSSDISRLHWLLLGIFGLLVIASFPQQLLLLFLLMGLAAIIKGPAMLIYGAIYSFLVGLFPPLGIILSALFFLISIKQITRNWRFGLTASFFYLYPLGITAFKHFTTWDSFWVMALLTGVGIIGSHYLLVWLYKHYGNGRSVAWSLLTVPYDCLMFFIPSKKKKSVPFKKRWKY